MAIPIIFSGDVSFVPCPSPGCTNEMLAGDPAGVCEDCHLVPYTCPLCLETVMPEGKEQQARFYCNWRCDSCEEGRSAWQQ